MGSRALVAALTTALLAGASAHAEPARDAALKALLDGAKASHSDAMLILHDGKELASYRKPGEPPNGIEMMSATKSLVGLAVGRLLTQKKLRSIDQPVSDFYPEWKQGQKAKITLKMLLNHTSGLQNVGNATVEIYPAQDGIKLALAAELSDPPGTRFSYNNKAMNLLAGVIEKASGERMDLYIERELLRPMGIDSPPWDADGFDHAGNPFAMAGWCATAEEAAKIGELVLAGGRWNGKQLVDAAYVREMVGQSQPFTPQYGLLWWRRSETETFEVDAKALDTFAARGVNKALLERLRPLAAHRYDGRAEFHQALAKAMGNDFGALGKDASAHGLSPETLVKTQMGPIVAYEANGYLGQFIVVVPKAHLVAVRQVRADDDADGKKPWPNGYDDFTARVIALAKTFTPDLAVQ